MDERDEHRAKSPALRVVAGGVTPARREEDALVAAFLLGDDDAFGELVRRNEPLVLSLVRRYARTPDDARDLAQRTFLRAFEAARRALHRGGRRAGRDAVPFRRWLVRVAVNLAKNHVRDEARRARAALAEAGGHPLEPAGARHGAGTADAPDALGAMARAEEAARLRLEVLRLPRRQREVLTLRIDGELPFAEIADALGITENAAKVTFHHATKRLRAALAAAGEEGRP